MFVGKGLYDAWKDIARQFLNDGLEWPQIFRSSTHYMEVDQLQLCRTQSHLLAYENLYERTALWTVSFRFSFKRWPQERDDKRLQNDERHLDVGEKKQRQKETQRQKQHGCCNPVLNGRLKLLAWLCWPSKIAKLHRSRGLVLCFAHALLQSLAFDLCMPLWGHERDFDPTIDWLHVLWRLVWIML